MKLTQQFKQQVIAELLNVRKKFSGSDVAFARQYGLHHSVYSQLKNGKNLDGLIRDSHWLNMGRELGISTKPNSWKFVRTEVVERIEEEVIFCKENAKAMILVDEPEIGKTVAARHLSKTVEDCFYVDCSQAKKQRDFTKALAQSIGVELSGKFSEIKANIKYYLNMLPAPVVILDDAGDLDYSAFLDIKEYWNGTEGKCGWYMIGSDGLKAKFENGIRNKKAGFRENFSRFSSKFRKIVPTEKGEKTQFYRQLTTDVLRGNCADKSRIPELVKKCIVPDANQNIAALRRAESLLILSQPKQAA